MCLTWRLMMAPAWRMRGSSRNWIDSRAAELLIGASGLRSSCASIARNSSFMRERRSASTRAARSLCSSASRSRADFWAISYRWALSIATAAWAATPATMRSVRSVNTPGSGWPKNRPPSTAPERDTTGTAR